MRDYGTAVANFDAAFWFCAGVCRVLVWFQIVVERFGICDQRREFVPVIANGIPTSGITLRGEGLVGVWDMVTF